MSAVTSLLEDPLAVFLTGMLLLVLFFWYFATDIERRKRNIGSVLLLGVCGLCVLAATPLKERLKGGIDIRGGSSFTLRVQPREAAPLEACVLQLLADELANLLHHLIDEHTPLGHDLLESQRLLIDGEIHFDHER